MFFTTLIASSLNPMIPRFADYVKQKFNFGVVGHFKNQRIYRNLSMRNMCVKLSLEPCCSRDAPCVLSQHFLEGSQCFRGDAVAFAKARQYLLFRHPPALSRFKGNWKAHGSAGLKKRVPLTGRAFFIGK